jgi:hypothetical protein
MGHTLLCLTSFRKGQFYAWMTSRVVECGVTSLALSLRLIAARRGQCAGTKVAAAAVGLQAREEWELVPQQRGRRGGRSGRDFYRNAKWFLHFSKEDHAGGCLGKVFDCAASPGHKCF